MFRKTMLAAALVSLAAGTAIAQQPSTGDERGFVSYAAFGSSFNASGHVVKLDTSAGYNLTEHIGVDFGVPFYFVGGTSTSPAGARSNFSASGMGAPYIAVRAMYSREESFSYTGRFAVYLPAGDVQDGLSSGQTSIDWTNHFEVPAGRFVPFGEIGIANTIADTSRYNRPYSSFGNNLHIQGGAIVDLSDKFFVGASMYDVFPWGVQALYSRAAPKGSSNLQANSSKDRPFERFAYSTGTSDLGKDKGFSAWADYTPLPYMTAEVAYNRSLQYAMNTVSFNVRFNLGYLAKNRGRH